MSRRKKGRIKRCTSCGIEKPMIEFYHKSNFCMECKASKIIVHNPHYRSMENLRKLQEEVRWKDAIIIKDFKFKGTIPEPKHESYYSETN